VRLLYSADPRLTGGEIGEAELVELYRHPLPAEGPVWLRSNFVTSLDGSVAGPDGRAASINTASDHFVFALHRAHADAIVVGAQTVRSEHYRAVDLAPWQRRLRAAEGLADFPTLAIVTRSLDLDPGLARHGRREVGPVVIFTTSGKSARTVSPFTAAGIEVVQLGGGDVDLTEVTRRLAERGCLRLLAEGGPRLHHELLTRQLVDELSLTLAPVAVGGNAPRLTAGGWLPERAFRLRTVVYADDETVFLSYRRAVAATKSKRLGVTLLLTPCAR